MEKPWFVREEAGVVIDGDLAYLRYLKVIGCKEKEITTERLEIARLVFTEDLAQTLGRPLHIKIPRHRYGLKKFPGDPNIVPRFNGGWERFYKNLPGTPASRVGLI